MSTNKTQIDQAIAEHFVQERFQVPNLKLERISDGETAEAFYFESPEGLRVLRVNSQRKYGFQKDQIAHERFASSVPIPKIYEIGQMGNGFFYALSERAPGKTLDKFSSDEINNLMPDLIATLDAIHTIPPIGDGYGNWDLDGKGNASTWRESLERSMRLDDDETTNAGFYDAKLVKQLRQEISNTLGLMPEERKLVHWDYGFNNALSDGKKITGVIDWEQSAYGDFLHDVAWLDFWNEKQGYAQAFKSFYDQQGRDVPRFDERLICYKLLIGLSSLGFFAKSRQEDKYKHAKEVIARIPR